MPNQDPYPSFTQRAAASLRTTRYEVWRPFYEAVIEATPRPVIIGTMLLFDTAAVVDTYHAVTAVLSADASGAFGRTVGALSCLAVAETLWRVDGRKQLVKQLEILDEQF